MGKEAKVARASMWACMGVVITAALAGASWTVAAPATLGLPAVLGQTKPSRLSSALYSGIECYRRGEYEQAGALFQEAQAGRDSLPAETRQELDKYLRLNNMALQARAEGGSQLRQAEAASKAGRQQEAAALLKNVTTNPFLSPEDRQKANSLNASVSPVSVVDTPSSGDSGGITLLARSKLRQSREFLNKCNFSAAETLAHEAAQLKAVYTAGEDTPIKVLDDVARYRNDPKYLLQGARAAMARQEFDDAEKLAHLAEKNWGLSRRLSPFGDSPSKVLKDIAVARRTPHDNGRPVATPTSGTPAGPAKVETFKKNLINWMTPGSKPDPKCDACPEGAVAQKTTDTKNPPAKATPAGSATDASTAAKVTPVSGKGSSIPDDEAHKLLRDARKALSENRLEDARKLLTKAKETKTTYTWAEVWWDPDQPDKVEADLRRAEAKRTGGDAVAKANEPKPDAAKKPTTRDDVRAQVKKARELMKAGNVDEAEKVASQARMAAPRGTWGLFDDSPDKVLVDVRKAKAKRDRDESDRLLAEARKAYQEGHLDDAKKKANLAAVKHGPYSVWEFGDRPQRLIDEIEVAEAKSRKSKTPTPAAPKEDTVVARAPEHKAGGPTPTDHVPPLTPPEATADARTLEARKLLAEARTAIRDGNTDLAVKLATQVQTMNVAQDKLGSDTPDSVLQEIQRLKESGTAVAAAPTPPMPQAAPTPLPAPPVNDPQTIRARELLAESRRLQNEGKLVESREKALDAQKLGATFLPDEDRPERALLELAGLAQKRIEGLMTSATELTTGGDPARLARAEETLAQARALAVGFALDTQPIDGRVATIREAQGKAAVATSPALMPPVGGGSEEASAQPTTPEQQGLRLLDQARVEITRGNTSTARRMAEEAFKGPYGGPVQAQAEFVLRSIDAEEFNQRRNQANRSFEAALSAYTRGDMPQARGILAAIDVTLLDRDKATRYKEMMRAPEMKPPAVAQVSDRDPNGAAHVTVSDDPNAQKSMPSGDTGNFAQKVAGLQEIQFQHMREEGLKAQREAIESMRRGEADRALEILNAYLDDLGRSSLDPGKTAMLRKGVENRVQQFTAARDQMAKATADKDRSETFKSMMNKKMNADQQKKELVASQMKQYHDLYKQGKYKEAELAARKAHEVDPDNVAADAAIHVAKMAGRVQDARQLRDDKEVMVLEELNESEREGPPLTMKKPIDFGPDYADRAGRRQRKDYEFNPLKSDKEREIERRLMNPISFQFENKPLRKVLEEISDLSGINVVPDKRALDEKGINLDLPMTQKLEGISLKSALNIVLDQAHLTYVIKDEVLKVTTPDRARGGMQSKTYQVADLVVPVDNYTVGGHADLQNVTDKLNSQRGGFATSMNTPYQGPMSLPGGSAVGSPGDGTVSPGQSMSGSVSGNGAPQRSPLPQAGAMSSKQGRAPGQTMEDVLINLITNTIEPSSWAQMGGAGTIDYFPLGMALVVNQTPDIQEQIAELLAALRRLQDVEVAIEVRFITISESFYERIGVDFNLNVLTDTTKWQPAITSGVFAPPGFINAFRPNQFVSGLTPAGTFTHDLNIPITNSSFGPAMAMPFGGFPIAPGADGGLSLGMAFLSDIQVFLFLEAAQGDRRTNIMQAPKLTMFNAQTATILVQDTVFFVTGNIIGLFNGQTTYSPQNQPFNIGLQLTMQPVVSADRRFVRVSLAPTLTNLSTPLAALFPFTTVITPTFDTGVVGQPIPITQYLQQPSFTTVGVQTTVSVPDGGTVLLGGLKTLREARNEFGPPILSKMPYVNRLFKNTAYGRDAESLMLMVTPRIIINEEEEERATGLRGGVAP